MSKKTRPRTRRRKYQARAKTYPSPADRERIIKRRDKLLRELIEILVVHQGDSRKIDKLIQRYGPQEVQLVLDKFQKRTVDAELIGDEASTYRTYRHTFARFGGARPFLSAQEYSDLSFEHARLNAEREFKSIIPRKPSARERELLDLLLIDAALWDDITPPAVPPRPPNFDAPSTGKYEHPAQQLLKWGWNLDEKRANDNARNVSKWRPAVGELVQMALDAGLLNGWPGETVSWAPYHALNMLGYLRAHEVAGQLFPLLEQENDWLSDRLAVTWGQMGSQAEPPLWDYVGDSEHSPDRRSVVMLGLANIAGANPGRRLGIVDELTGLLRRASVDDTQANAYLVHILDKLEAYEAAEVIADAFEQDKVEEEIISLESVSILDWNDPDVYDRFYGSQ
jgi:hypothetical protein